MFVNMKYCFDPKQARENHRLNADFNKYSLAVILRPAGVDFDWDYCGERINLIAKIVDRGNPDIPAVDGFAHD
jgi:hypothetical protein